MKYFYRAIGVTVLAYLILGLYALVAFNLKVFNPIAKAIGNYSIEDFYYNILGTSDGQDTSRVVTIVDMTELISRRDLARTIAEITSLNPKVLGVDIVFEGLKEDSVGDQMLTEAVMASHGVYSYRLIDRTDEAVHSFFTPCDSLTEGFTNMPRLLYDGTKRNLSVGRTHQGELRPSLIKLIADKYAGEEVMPLAEQELQELQLYRNTRGTEQLAALMHKGYAALFAEYNVNISAILYYLCLQFMLAINIALRINYLILDLQQDPSDAVPVVNCFLRRQDARRNILHGQAPLQIIHHGILYIPGHMSSVFQDAIEQLLFCICKRSH